MTTFSDVFGGSTVQSADVAYRAVALSANITTVWPPYATTGNQVARIMDVTPSGAGFSVALPDATLASVGQDVLFNNPGAFTYTVTDVNGNTVATVPPGQIKYLYLNSNSTANGTWAVVLFGAAASSLDAASLAGYGLKAIGASLNTKVQSATLSANFTITQTDRARLYVNTGGAITATLAALATVGSDFYFQLRNQGTGAITVNASAGELIDGVASIALNVNESCIICSGTLGWYTVGRGRNQQFNFTQLTKAVTGGTTTLTLSEASNVVQKYTGVLTSAETVVLPSVVQVYYIYNATTGAYTFTLKTAGVGSTLNLPSGQSAVVFCDGTNVINASTSISGISALLLGGGSAASPTLALADPANGLFAPSSVAVAVTAGGVEVARWVGAQQLNANGAVALPAYSFALSPATGAYSPATDTYNISTAGVQRMSIGPTGALSFTGSSFAGTLDFTGATVNVAAPTTNSNPATKLYADSLAFSSALPAQAGKTNYYVMTNGSTASWGFQAETSISASTATVVAGEIAAIDYAGQCSLTLAALNDNDEFTIIVRNGRTDNTLDIGARTLNGPVGSLTNVITFDSLPRSYTFKYSSATTSLEIL